MLRSTLASRLFAACALALGFLLALVPARVLAAEPPAKGVAVLVLGDPQLGAVTWGLAHDVYASPALLPSGITEARARSLVGQTAAATTPDTKELLELRDGVHDEGAVSRRVLTAIASSTHAAAVAVVRATEAPDHVQIRLYLVDRGAFDVTLYDGDPSDPAWRTDVVHALERRFDPQAKPAAPAKVVAVKRSETTAGSHPFYKSPWFWGAVGAAVLLGGTALVVTKVTSSDDVHVRVQPPSASSAALRF